MLCPGWAMADEVAGAGGAGGAAVVVARRRMEWKGMRRRVQRGSEVGRGRGRDMVAWWWLEGGNRGNPNEDQVERCSLYPTARVY